jgi:hypothetical protein
LSVVSGTAKRLFEIILAHHNAGLAAPQKTESNTPFPECSPLAF